MGGGTGRDVAMADLPAPSGWFAVAFSRELAAGSVRTTTLAGAELVLWRQRDGRLGAAAPVCPHLGAHLGAGSVDAGGLRCPFHGFTFATDGRCVAAGDGGRPPATARLGLREVRERHGVVLVWHHPHGEPPTFEIPDGDDGERPLHTACLELAGHPVATSENAVDLGHLAEVHGYTAVRLVRRFAADGPVARASYEMRRPLGLPVVDGIPGVRSLRTLVRFDVTLHGLGVSVVDVEVPAVGVRTRQLVLATPAAPGRVALRLGLRVRRPDHRRATRPLDALIGRVALAAFVHDVRRDVPIWNRQRYVPAPALAPGDGPIGAYRRWASQFMVSA